MTRLDRCYNVDDLRAVARRRLPPPMFHYIDGAADDEVTRRRNTSAFDDYHLVPRYLVDVQAVDMRRTVMGVPVAMPLMLAPTGMSRLFHHEGELAVARAAAAADIFYSLSTVGTHSIEAVAANAGPRLFQLYVLRDRGLNRELIQRCRDADYHGLILTVDVPVAGNRERDLRTGMTVPPRLTPASLIGMLGTPAWLWGKLTQPRLQLASLAEWAAASGFSGTNVAGYINAQFDRTVTWDDAEAMIAQWGGPFAIKGILCGDDARRAVAVGASAVIVSNHGGRQLDGAPGALDSLREVLDAVGDRAEVILDGGVRRGTHLLKALALGARACMTGRPYLYGLAAGGEPGVRRALTLLRESLERDMVLTGVRTLDELGPQHVRHVGAAR